MGELPIHVCRREFRLSAVPVYCMSAVPVVKTSPFAKRRAMSQFMEKVDAIRKALGLRPAEELSAPLAIAEAMVLMGITRRRSRGGAAREG